MATEDADKNDSTSELKSPSIKIHDLTEGGSSSPANENPSEESGEESTSWETDSFYEDAIEAIGDEEYGEASDEVCSIEEAVTLRRLLREVGDEEFIVQALESRKYTAKKLCTAFGVQPPDFLEGSPDIAYYRLLGICISRELSKRIKLPDVNTLADAASLLKSCNKIVVLTGAGISTSLGIPDFRSKNTGLYARMSHLGLSDPQEVFDISLFREDPTIFFSIAKDILPETTKYSPTHAFIRLLQDKGKLLTNFTQNIDNLEGAAGILPDKLIQCHGSFATATCQKCSAKVLGLEIYPEIKAGRVARCISCLKRIQQKAPIGIKRKRSSNGLASKKRRQDYEDSSDEEDYGMEVAGIMKPDITFFGENLPAKFHDRLIDHDKDEVDLVIVIGTSLKVAPVADIPGFFPPSVPQLYISRDPCSHIEFDVQLLGDCDLVVDELCKLAGWELKHEMIPNVPQEVEVKPDDNYESRWYLKVKAATAMGPATSTDTKAELSPDKPLPIRTSQTGTIAGDSNDLKQTDADLLGYDNPNKLSTSSSSLLSPHAALDRKVLNSSKAFKVSDSKHPLESKPLSPTLAKATPLFASSSSANQKEEGQGPSTG